MSLTINPTTSLLDPAVLRYLGKPLPAVCCDACSRLTREYVIDDESGAILCAECDVDIDEFLP